MRGGRLGFFADCICGFAAPSIEVGTINALFVDYATRAGRGKKDLFFDIVRALLHQPCVTSATSALLALSGPLGLPSGQRIVDLLFGLNDARAGRGITISLFDRRQRERVELG